MQQIRSLDRPVVTGVCHLNNSRALHQRSLVTSLLKSLLTLLVTSLVTSYIIAVETWLQLHVSPYYLLFLE